jgi:hypothetical protein
MDDLFPIHSQAIERERDSLRTFGGDEIMEAD